MSYPGIAHIGCEKLAGIYGVNEGIVDAKGTGVQHLYYTDFSRDRLHSATTLIKDRGAIYYGNRHERPGRHPDHLKPVESSAEQGYIFTDRFECDGFTRTDRAYGWGDANLGFETEITDTLGEEREIEVYAYLISQAGAFSDLKRDGTRVIASSEDAAMRVVLDGADRVVLVEEGPTGFIYRLTGLLLADEQRDQPVAVRPEMHSGIALGRKLTLPAFGTVHIDWHLAFAPSAEGLPLAHPEDLRDAADVYWETYLGPTRTGDFDDLFRANRVAIKSAILGGFVPADLTGHYYADGLPCYYARDALMAARAFLLSGRLDECRSIMTYLLARARKPTGEFYQRYDGRGEPNEGANNGVHRQLDSIGYMLFMVRAFAEAGGEQLLDDEEIVKLTDVIAGAEQKFGLVGPEGGVNEGVFGPAFITSSNMFISGGLNAAIAMLGTHPAVPGIRALNSRIEAGIKATFIAGQGYRYGYVTYHDELIGKYDTPQYFGPLYGFADTEEMRETHRLLLDLATFDGDGIGYSEQEYHHGPWTFNTAACAEYAALISDRETCRRKLDWLGAHANAYGIMPEAFSADDMSQCYINPLVWACAEVVSAIALGKTGE